MTQPTRIRALIEQAESDFGYDCWVAAIEADGTGWVLMAGHADYKGYEWYRTNQEWSANGDDGEPPRLAQRYLTEAGDRALRIFVVDEGIMEQEL